MDGIALIGLICTADSFRPLEDPAVRWLDREEDLTLFQHLRLAIGADPPTAEDWQSWHRQGYRYCGVAGSEAILAKAAVWPRTDTAWELAAVLTHPDCRGRGYAKAVCSFATASILAAGRTATCHTHTTNTAMLRVAESLGYCREERG
jgi:ribosomal protein S18 acetylase RimI-like enzyme